MRVIECNECGETISAANDEELQRRLGDHLRDEHELDSEEGDVEDLIHEQAYDAADA